MQLVAKKKIDARKKIKQVKSPVKHLPFNYGFSIPNLNPSDIKVAVLDTGVPFHSDLSRPAGRHEDFCIDLLPKKASIIDSHGHSTIVSGVLSASNPNTIIGMAPSATYYFCKVIDDNGDGETSSLTAGIIWALSQEVDIILICAGSAIYDRYLEKIIKKAYDSGIIIIAASGKEVVKENRPLYPASFNGVLCCSSSKNAKCLFNKDRNRLEIDIDASSVVSTFLNDSYIKASGSSMAASLVCGCAINFIADCRMRNIKINNVAEFMEKISNTFVTKNGKP